MVSCRYPKVMMFGVFRASLLLSFLASCGGDSGSACLDAGVPCVDGGVCVIADVGDAQVPTCVALPTECVDLECTGDATCKDALGALCPADLTFSGGSTCVQIVENGTVTADHVQISCW